MGLRKDITQVIHLWCARTLKTQILALYLPRSPQTTELQIRCYFFKQGLKKKPTLFLYQTESSLTPSRSQVRFSTLKQPIISSFRLRIPPDAPWRFAHTRAYPTTDQPQPPARKDLLDPLCCLVESFLTQLQGILFTSILLKSFSHTISFQEDVDSNREINRANLFCIIKVLKWWRCEIPVSLFSCSSLCRRIIEANWSLFHFSAIDVGFSWSGMKHIICEGRLLLQIKPMYLTEFYFQKCDLITLHN